MMQTDVKAVEVTSTGSAYASRTRVRGIVINYASGGTVALKDGGSSGATLFSFTAPAAAGSTNIIIPGEGVLFSTSVYASLSSATITVFYG
jgi:hypothetical protein